MRKKRREMIEIANMGKEKEEKRKRRGDNTGDNGKNTREKKVERRNKIKETRYNILYKNIMVEAVPSYLLEIQKKKERSLVRSYKCGNEMKGGH